MGSDVTRGFPFFLLSLCAKEDGYRCSLGVPREIKNMDEKLLKGQEPKESVTVAARRRLREDGEVFRWTMRRNERRRARGIRGLRDGSPENICALNYFTDLVDRYGL